MGKRFPRSGIPTTMMMTAAESVGASSLTPDLAPYAAMPRMPRMESINTEDADDADDE
jgi:hypothetical protein